MAPGDRDRLACLQLNSMYRTCPAPVLVPDRSASTFSRALASAKFMPDPLPLPVSEGVQGVRYAAPPLRRGLADRAFPRYPSSLSTLYSCWSGSHLANSYTAFAITSIPITGCQRPCAEANPPTCLICVPLPKAPVCSRPFSALKQRNRVLAYTHHELGFRRWQRCWQPNTTSPRERG